MVLRLILLHLRFFAIFFFVGSLAVLFGHLGEGGFAGLTTAKLWSGMMAILSTCAALGVLVPWGMFLIDPKRSQPRNVDGFIAYWKLRP